MAKADKRNLQTIKECLNTFCNMSGQKINRRKSKILFSQNCPIQVTKEIASGFNINIANKFGNYLGFPILNNAPKAKDYQFIIEKMRAKLSNWKINFLNIAGRTTLALATLNSIPNHAMQYTLLPKKPLNLLIKFKGILFGALHQIRKNFTLLIRTLLPSPKL